MFIFFFFNDTATTEIYTLSLHDALPIYQVSLPCTIRPTGWVQITWESVRARFPRSARDRKSTRLNSSHSQISYAVFCLKKKNSNRPVYTAPVVGAPPLQSRLTNASVTCS